MIKILAIAMICIMVDIVLLAIGVNTEYPFIWVGFALIMLIVILYKVDSIYDIVKSKPVNITIDNVNGLAARQIKCDMTKYRWTIEVIDNDNISHYIHLNAYSKENPLMKLDDFIISKTSNVLTGSLD